MNGIPAALSASVLWGSADFLAGRATRTHPVLLVAFLGQAAGLIVLSAILAFHGIDAHALLPGAITGLIGIVGVLALYSALGLGTMSIVAPIGATSAIVPVVWGIAGGERPGALQWAGVVLALTGVILAAREPTTGGSKDAKNAIRLALLAALAIGFSLVTLDKAAEHDSLTGVFAARVRLPHAKALAGMGGIGLLDTSANVAFAIATTGGLLSLVSVLGGLFPVVTVALAYALLHERLARPQRVGVVLALVGVPLISAG